MHDISRMQDAPKTFDITTVCYLSKTKHIEKIDHIFDGKTTSILIPKERSVDIDDKIDFEYAEYLFKKLGNGKK